MAIAYILISTEIGVEKQVLDEIKQFKEVEYVNIVYGNHDIIAKIKGESQLKIKTGILEKLRTLDKIRSTMSLIGY